MKDMLTVATYAQKHLSTMRIIGARLRGSDFFAKVAETFTTRVLLMAIGLVTNVLVARTLGPQGRGLYAVALTLGMLGVQFGQLGLQTANTFFSARDRSLLPTLVGNSLVVSFGVCSLGAVLVGAFFTFQVNIAPLHGVLLLLALAWVPFGQAYMLLQTLLLGIQDIRAYNKIELTTKVLSLALMGLLILTHRVRPETIFGAGLVALITSFLWAYLRLRPHLNTSPSPSWPCFLDHMRYGFRAYLAMLGSVAVMRINVLLVQYHLGETQAGYYSIATGTADLIYMLPVVIGTILFPRLSAMSDPVQQRRIASRVAVIVTIIMLPMAGAAALLSRPLLSILYGASFIPAVPAFNWLLPGIILLSINTIWMNYFASTGMPPITVYSPFIATILCVVINFQLVPVMGIIGASLSSVFAYAAMLAMSTLHLFLNPPRGLSESHEGAVR